jgi:cell division protein FtsN
MPRNGSVDTPRPVPTSVLKPTPNSSSTPPITSTSLSEKIWLVMLGGYREQNWSTAETRRDYLQKQGFNAYIVDTNNYQNLDPNLHAIVMGPYSMDEAIDVAELTGSSGEIV